MLVLLPGIHNLDEATRIAEEIRGHVAQPIHESESGQTITVTLSIGAALAGCGETASTIMARADAAMYHGKKARGNTVIGIP